jgi:hypothetical protein
MELFKTYNLYNLDGDDWATLGYRQCKDTTGAPIDIKPDSATPYDNKYYYIMETVENAIGTLQLEDMNNNLVLNFTEPIGTIFYNLEPDQLDPDVIRSYYFHSTAIYFKLPGEHKIEGKSFDMEIQIYSYGKLVFIKDEESYYRKTFVSFPVIISEEHQQPKLFEALSQPKLGEKYTIPTFADFVYEFNMFNRVFFYKGKLNII